MYIFLIDVHHQLLPSPSPTTLDTMPHAHEPRPSTATLQDIFLIPNLHCPSCITHISSLMSELDPAPLVQDISIIDHHVTITHERSVTAATIREVLNSGAYEVFDIVQGSASQEILAPLHDDKARLEAAVQRWSPLHPGTDDPARTAHDAHCQMCAAFSSKRGEADLKVTTTIESVDSAPSYLAVLSIEGMTCSSCVGHVKTALMSVPFVTTADVVLVSHSANVRFQVEGPDDTARNLVEAVENAGYGAELVDLNPEAGKGRKESKNDVDAWQATYSIEGMTCSSCVAKVTNAVKQLPFVERVDINLVAHSGTVVFAGKGHTSLIIAAIDDSGYKATQTEITTLGGQEQSSSRTVSLRITGMHCPRCPQRILDGLKHLPVEIDRAPAVDDSIITISYTPDSPTLTVRKIMDAIRDLDKSFTVSIHKTQSVEERSRRMLTKERKAIFLRALLSIVTAIPTLIIGVVYMNLVPHHDPGYMYMMHPLHGVSRLEWATFVMATPVYCFAADHFHRRTIKEVYALWRPRSSVPILTRFYRFGSMNMLISLGTTIAYFSSLAQLIVAAIHPSGNTIESSKQSYFDSVVFLSMFLLIGRLAEAHMKAKSGDAVAALGRLRPTDANLVTGVVGTEESATEKINVDLVDTGDVVKVFQGSTPPCDGILLDENAKFDESSLTGESRTISKTKGDSVFSGTINKGPAISIKATGPAGASMLDSIIQVVREGQTKRAPMERVADLLTAYFVPVIVAIAVFTWVIWLALGLSGTLPNSYLDNGIGGWGFWSLQFAIAVFVIACPCGLGLAAPTALFVGGGMAAKRGILVKGGGEAFQEASNLDAVVFDKTGTLTEGTDPKIVRHTIFTGSSGLDDKATILGILRAVEENSSHPLARAAVDFANSHSASTVMVTFADEVAGKGLKASFRPPNSKGTESLEALVGNESLMYDHAVAVPSGAAERLDSWKNSGYSVILLACRESEKWQLKAIFAAADALRPESADVVRALQSQNVDVWMLSGDNLSTAKAVGRQVGISPENIIAGVLPAQKADKVKHLQRTVRKRRGRGLLGFLTNRRPRATVAMVGDGINDAPALAAADVGIAVASGSDVAVQSAAFVLVHSDLRAVLTLVTLSRAVFRRVIINFFWAAIYNIVALPIAAGVLYPIKTEGGSHVRLDPAWAALAMALSSITVVGSSLLLRTRIPWVGFRDLKNAPN